MAKITIDGTTYAVADGQNLLQACLELNLNLPYFCWHPALGSVGACRQCAVLQYQNAEDQRGRLVMACMTPVSDGLLIGLNPPPAKAFRAGIIESLMTNHPHDCPVCEEGGECHLQDMTVMSGHHRRRYRGPKRTFENQDLGPFINHEMNRCITCFRCVRYYRDYAGGRDLNAFAQRNRTFFGRYQSGPLESEFSGNLVEVCPTGVFTDRTLSAHYSRKWDLQQAPSLCPHCSVGCNTSPGERYGTLRRIQNRYHGEVNGYFLCDRGRFGYGFVNHPQRPSQPWARSQESSAPAPLESADASARLAAILDQFQGKLLGIGSPRASLEDNLALRMLVGPKRFVAGFSHAEEVCVKQVLAVLRDGGTRTPSLREVEDADAMLVLGEDPTQTAPRLALSLRRAVRGAARERASQIGIPLWQTQAVQNLDQERGYPLFIATPDATRLDDVATGKYRDAPDELARLGFAIAHRIDPQAPPVADLHPHQQAEVERIAVALQQAKQPLIVAGCGALHEPLIHAAAQIARALTAQRRKDQQGPAWLSYTVPECNSLGVALLAGSDAPGLPEACAMVAAGEVKAALVLENDLDRRAEAPAIERLREQLEQLVVIDHLPHALAQQADLFLPSTSFAESSGTWINQEGRAQYRYPVFQREGVQEAWRWLSAACRNSATFASQPVAAWERSEQVLRNCARELGVAELATLQAAPSEAWGPQPIARQPHRYSGRTAMFAHRDVHEPQTRADRDTAFNYSMEGVPGMLLAKAMQQSHDPQQANLLPFSWAPGWNSNQANHRFQPRGEDAHSASGVHVFGEKTPPRAGQNSWFQSIPAPWKPCEDGLQVVPLTEHFGCEEFSALADPIRQRSPVPYVALNPDDAADLGLTAGCETGLRVGRCHYRLRVHLSPHLVRGLAGLPLGLGDLRGIELPAIAHIEAPGPGALISSDRGAPA